MKRKKKTFPHFQRQFSLEVATQFFLPFFPLECIDEKIAHRNRYHDHDEIIYFALFSSMQIFYIIIPQHSGGGEFSHSR